MLSNKEITKKFDIPKSTIYSWKVERPKVYEYLAMSDEQYEKYRKVNILLEEYIKSTDINCFNISELKIILSLNLCLDDFTDVKNIELLFINATQIKTKETTKSTLTITQKLSSLNLIEKYVFCERIKTILGKLKSKNEDKNNLIRYYFSEFLILTD